jgi:hypothetical protein
MPFQQEKQSMDLTEEQWERLEPLMPDRLVGDRAYDSDPLDEALEEQSEPLRLATELHEAVVRYEYKDENFLGMAQLECIVILLRKCL